jgi:hypothetical protein
MDLYKDLSGEIVEISWPKTFRIVQVKHYGRHELSVAGVVSTTVQISRPVLKDLVVSETGLPS